MSRKGKFQDLHEIQRKTYFRVFRVLVTVLHEIQGFQGPLDSFKGFQGSLDTMLFGHVLKITISVLK